MFFTNNCEISDLFRNLSLSLGSSAQNIHTESDWDIIFTLLECVGAGAIPADYEESLTLTQVYQGNEIEKKNSSYIYQSAIK